MAEPLIVTPSEAIISCSDAKAIVPALASADDIAVDWQIRQATAAAENYIQKAIGIQTLSWTPDECVVPFLYAYNAPVVVNASTPYWPYVSSYFELPKPPLRSVTSVVYLDDDGDEQTFDADNYTVSGVGRRGRITLKSGSSWPTLGNYPEALTITYVAGYDTVPEPIVHAVLLMAAEGTASSTSEAVSGIRSVTREGYGSITYAGETGSSTKSSSGQSMSQTVRDLLNPYVDY
jgi:hypothetical protein